MSSAAFKQLWLDTDTWIGPMTPPQVQKLRALCEKFYEAGRGQGLAYLTGACRNSGKIRLMTPEGQQSVPLEPTDEMAKAGYEAMWNEKLHEEKMFCSAIAVYKAMLAAAPK